jgi:sigma-E factor negative regulatory protein RseC
MICETGRVVGIETDALWVETIQRSTCSSCSAQKGCGQGLMNKALAGRRNQLRVLLGDLPAEDFSLDDEVSLSIPERALVGGAMLVYLLPLLTMLGGMMLLSQSYSGDGPAALGALLGFVLGMLLVRLHASLIHNKPAYQPRIVANKSPLATQNVTLFDPSQAV